MHITLASLVYKTRSTKYGFKVTVMITRIWYQSHFSRGLCSPACSFCWDLSQDVSISTY